MGCFATSHFCAALSPSMDALIEERTVFRITKSNNGQIADNRLLRGEALRYNI